MIRSVQVPVIALFTAVALCASAGSVSAQPAPALTKLQVIGVASSGYMNGNSWDNVPAGAVTTPKDHSGPELLVAVYEEGYANNQIAYFNGARMQLIKSEPQVGANRRIYGYIRYYYIRTNFTGGTFTNQATSINAPFRTLSTRLTIR